MDLLKSLLIIFLVLVSLIIFYYLERIKGWYINDLRYKYGFVKWIIGVILFFSFYILIIYFLSK